MGARSPATSLKPIHRSAHGIPGILVAAASLTVLSAAVAAQTSGVDAEKRPFTQQADGPERPGPPPELLALSRRPPSGPTMDHSVPPAMRYHLRIAFDTAMRALRKEPACRGLFQRIGADGEAVLARSSYSCVPESLHCLTGVAAFTTVGSTHIRLCHGFQVLHPSTAAVLLLHEALHSSGLLERPPHASALTAKEISATVSQGCRLN